MEFGERAAQTAIRELREEIGAEIENVRYLATLESIFERAGQPGHQIVFLFDADFADRSHYAAELIIGTESMYGSTLTAARRIPIEAPPVVASPIRTSHSRSTGRGDS